MQSGSAREAEVGRYDTAELSFTLSHLRADVAHKAEQLQQRMADADMLRARAQAAGADAWCGASNACSSWQPRKAPCPIYSSHSCKGRLFLLTLLEQQALSGTSPWPPHLSVDASSTERAPETTSGVTIPQNEPDPAGALTPSTPERAPATSPGASPARRSILEKLGVRRDAPAVVTIWDDEGQEPGELVAAII